VDLLGEPLCRFELARVRLQVGGDPRVVVLRREEQMGPARGPEPGGGAGPFAGRREVAVVVDDR